MDKLELSDPEKDGSGAVRRAATAGMRRPPRRQDHGRWSFTETGEVMHYVYLSAVRVYGLFIPSPYTIPLTLHKDAEIELRIISAQDSVLDLLDRNRALQEALRYVTVTREGAANYEERSRPAFQSFKQERINLGNAPVFLVCIQGPEVSIPPNEIFDCAAFGVNTSPITSAEELIKKAQVCALENRALLTITNTSVIGFEPLGELTFLTGDKLVFIRDAPPTLEIKGRAIAIAGDPVEAFSLGRSQTKLNGCISAVLQLVGYSFDEWKDPLRAFLFAWSALEAFVEACFATLELEELIALNSRVPDKDLHLGPKRIRKQRGYLGITDCLPIVLMKLCFVDVRDHDPGTVESIFRDYWGRYDRIRQFRNYAVHEGKLNDPDMPVTDTRDLLRYLLGYMSLGRVWPQ